MRQFLHTSLKYWFKRSYSCPVRVKKGGGERGREVEERQKGRGQETCKEDGI